MLPDRTDVKMTAPFMRAYTELLVATCHRRGAFAMGGMAALIPSRTDAEANQRAIDAVRADKRREAGAGFDGTWVAHPDLVAVAAAEFDEVLGDRPNQIDRQRDGRVGHRRRSCSTPRPRPGAITEAGLRNNVNVGFQLHLVLALRPRRRRHQQPDGGRRHRRDLALPALAVDPARRHARRRAHRSPANSSPGCLDEEMAKIHAEVGDEVWQRGRPEETREVFERVALGDDLPEFLTLVAYDKL